VYGRFPDLLPAMLILGGAAAWGLLWLPLRYVEAHGLAGAWAPLAAFFWPAVAAAPLAWRQRAALRPWRRQLAAFGALSGLGFGLYTVGLVYSGVVRVTLLFYLTPVWSALFALALLGETTRWQGWLAAVTGLAGLALVLGTGGDESLPLNTGDGFALASGVFWALAVLVLRRHPDIPPSGTVAAQFLFATGVILVICLVDPGKPPLPTLGDWLLGGAVVGLFSAAVLLPGLFGIFWAAGRLPPARVGILMMTEVLVAIVSATLLAAERLTALEWTGGAMIVGAALLEVLAKPPPTR
jgi:drug/metabolite transporter (DMT)-like permease